MSSGPVPDPTHDVLVEIRDELRALRRDLFWQDDDDTDVADQDTTSVPVDGR